MTRLSRTVWVGILCTTAFFTLAQGALCSQRAAQTAQALADRGLDPLLITGLISMLPVFELRGGIPVGIALLGQKPLLVYLAAVVFNVVPVFPILLFLNPLRKLLEKLPLFSAFFRFVSRRVEKNRTLVQRYQEFGLMLFVAVPLPVTGAWTGSLVAAVMGLRIGRSFFFIFGGVLIAGVLVTLLTLLGKVGIAYAAGILGMFALSYALIVIRRRKQPN